MLTKKQLETLDDQATRVYRILLATGALHDEINKFDQPQLKSKLGGVKAELKEIHQKISAYLERMATYEPEGKPLSANRFKTLVKKTEATMSNSSQGFSLVEMMVAVGIMGTLTAVAVPTYNKQKLMAARAQVKSNLQTVVKTQQLFQLTNSDGHYAEKLNDPDDKPNSLGLNLDGDFSYGVSATGTGKSVAIADEGKFKIDSARGEFRLIAVAKPGICNQGSGKEVWCADSTGQIGNGSPGVGTTTGEYLCSSNNPLIVYDCETEKTTTTPNKS